ARVSYDAAWRAGQDTGSDHRLIRYLWSHRHTTPFEAVTLTFEVHAPIFVLRQWHRHRTWSYNEVSARYRELPNEFYVPEVSQVCEQSKLSKQGRGVAFDKATAMRVQDAIVHSGKMAFDQYQALLDAGVARELARSVLPVGTYSTMFATVNLLNFLKFLTLRCDPHAQYEIRAYANAMRELARAVAPVCLEAWEEGDAS
ncbi:MAG: FAD-dependent thymidylate synthase, partial [Pseudomonadota bacterium]